MRVSVHEFKGQIPRHEPQALPPGYAQEAVNCKLWSGNLRPYGGAAAVVPTIPLFERAPRSLFRFSASPSQSDNSGFFFNWAGIAHAARVPIPGDRLWTTVITGNGQPPQLAALDISTRAGGRLPSFTERLGLPVPDVRGVVARVSGTPAAGSDAATDGENRNYVVAYVNTRGHLGPTSLPFAPNDVWLPGQQVDITGLPTAVNGYLLASKRIYRLAASGLARFFVAEIPLTTTAYSDRVDESALGEQELSAEWEQPPEDMHGFGVLDNGICYGASRNQICVSKAYLPYAWSPLDRQTVNYDVVGIGHIGTTIVALTGENPVLVYGYSAESLRQETLNINQGCLSEQGVVSGRFGVVYPSKDGLVMISGGQANVVTEPWYTRDGWATLNPRSFNAALYADRYLAFYGTLADGGTFIFDPNNPSAGLVFADVWGTAIYADPVARALYYVRPGAGLLQWDADQENPLTYRWKSKEFVTQHHVAVNYGRILADSYANLRVEFWVDKVLQYSGRVSNREPFPMNAGRMKGRVFEFRLTGTDTVTEATFVSSPLEFRG